eukprot:7637387-Pyramimonas_sp.AAC.2
MVVLFPWAAQSAHSQLAVSSLSAEEPCPCVALVVCPTLSGWGPQGTPRLLPLHPPAPHGASLLGFPSISVAGNLAKSLAESCTP